MKTNVDAGRQEAPASVEQETAFQRALVEEGRVVQWPTGSHGPAPERIPLAMAGRRCPSKSSLIGADVATYFLDYSAITNGN